MDRTILSSPAANFKLDARIAAAIQRATQRGHYAQFVGRNPRTNARAFFVKSTSGVVAGYNVLVHTSPDFGGFCYVPGIWSVCECRAAQKGWPCDHAAKASRAAQRRLQASTAA